MSENTNLTKIAVKNTELSIDDLKTAETLSKRIDIKSEQSIMNFGVETQKKLGDSSTKILAQVKTKDADEAGEALASLVQQVQGYDINQSWFEKTMSKLPVLGKIFDHTRKIIAQHKTVESNLDEIVHRLDKSRLSLVKDNVNMKSLYEENVKFIKENNINIEALNIKMREIQEELIPTLEKEVFENPEDHVKVQELSKMKNLLNRLDKKTHNMKLFNVSAIQSLPRLNLIQDSNNNLVESINFSVLNVIPLWRNQVAEAIALNKQKRVADLQEAVYNMTNELIKNNAIRSKENTIAISKQMERGIIDIETLERANKEFMDTLDEVIKIKEEGAKNRIEAEKKIEQIKLELSEKIKSVHIMSSVENETVDTEYTEIDNEINLMNSKEKI